MFMKKDRPNGKVPWLALIQQVRTASIDLADTVRQTGWLRVSEFYEVILSCICVMAVQLLQTS